MTFSEEIKQGIPNYLPDPKPYDPSLNHAPKRKEILNDHDKELALRNALRYFPPELHSELLPEFREELGKHLLIIPHFFIVEENCL